MGPWIDALYTFFQPVNLLAMVGGSLIGIVSGILPGIGATVMMSLLIPFTFNMPALAGLILLLSVWSTDVYGGSITSILVNVPGGAANVATCYDGHPMAQKGEAEYYQQAIDAYQFALVSFPQSRQASTGTFRIAECYRQSEFYLEAKNQYLYFAEKYPNSQQLIDGVGCRTIRKNGAELVDTPCSDIV